MKVQVERCDLYLYSEVWEILKWKDGFIYKTRTTGKYVRSPWENPDTNKWVASSVSTKLLNGIGKIELELF